MTDQTVTVTVPFAIRKRGGRTLVITPDGVTSAPAPRTRVDSALLKALARGFRWRKLLETGDFATIEGIAKAENINPSYISRVLRLTLLAPESTTALEPALMDTYWDELAFVVTVPMVVVAAAPSR